MPQPIDPFPIYKDGQHRMVHGVDYPGWAQQGWTLEPSVTAEIQEDGAAVPPSEPSSATPTEPTTYEARKAELESLIKETQGWRHIERIARELGITQKPAGGWDDAIPMILEQEGLTAA